MRLTENDVVLRYEALESERKNLDGQYELIERFVMPGKGRFFNEGVEDEESIDWRHREIYDGTAQNAVVLLSASLAGSLTSPSATWFELAFRSDDLNDDREASAWLEECAVRMRSSLNDSNFSLEAMEVYQDGAGYGTAVMLHNEAPGAVPTEWNGHRFRAEMLRQCYFEEDADGNVTAVFVKRMRTPMQLALQFGKDALPQHIRDKVDNPGTGASSKEEELIYAIYFDVDKAEARPSAKVLPVGQRPYVGRYVLAQGRTFIGKEQGFYEFPGYVLRWQRTAGSKYGHSPGLIALGDILTLQEMVKMVRTATEKAVDPPMKSTRRGIIGDVYLEAGGITFVRDPDALLPLMPPGAYRVDVGWADIEDIRRRIRQSFYVDQLELKESPAMTATEVQVRYDMMQRLLGPTLGRIQTDFLDPLIQRTFWMMFRKGALPPMPESVSQAKETDLDIEYVGPLARAQRIQSVDAIQRWLGLLASMGELFPEMLDMPDTDEIAKFTARTLGVPAKLVRSETDVEERREDRRQAAESAAQAEQAATLAGAAKDANAAGLMPAGGGNGAALPGEGAGLPGSGPQGMM